MGENNWNQSFWLAGATCTEASRTCDTLNTHDAPLWNWRDNHSYFDRFGDTDANNPSTPWLASLAPSQHKLSCSRIGVRRVSFNAYSRDQLKEILARNWDLDSSGGFDVDWMLISGCFMLFPLSKALHNRIRLDSWGQKMCTLTHVDNQGVGPRKTPKDSMTFVIICRRSRDCELNKHWMLSRTRTGPHSCKSADGGWLG